MFEKNSNIKTELLDLIQFDDNIPAKCGEFFVTKFGEISVTCLICVATFEDLKKFTEHITKGHLNLNNEFEEININNTLEIEYLNENVIYQSEFDLDDGSSASKTNKIQFNVIKSEDEPRLTDVNSVVDSNENTDTEDVEQSDITKNFTFQCNECSINFKGKLAYLSHMKLHKNKNFIIKINKSDAIKDNDEFPIGSQEPKNRHLKELKIEPLEFDSKFKRANGKDKTNENSLPFCCKSCPKKFERKVNLVKHEAKHNSEKHNCHFCGKFFLTNFEMKQHVATHTGEKPYICGDCGAAFNCKGNLKNHYLKHSDYRPHQCNFQCGKSFKTSRERVWHERIHTGEKPFQCEQCGDNFAHQHKLKLHKKRNHMDPSLRPHKCTYDGCIKAFLFPRQLREHLNTHSGEKPFKCDQCSSAFAKTSGLKEHKKLHSGVRKHVCKICGKAFTQIAGLATHRKIHTNLKKNNISEKEYDVQYNNIEFVDFCKKN